MSPLEGKTALVTGVTSGIGAALTERLVEAGARVFGVGRSAARLAERGERWGSRFVPLEADLSSPDARAALVAHIGEAIPALDLFVNNAAECVYETPLRLSAAKWRALFEVNVFAAIELAQVLAPRVRPGGHVVMVSSVTTRFLANPKFAPYAASKVLLEHFASSLRLELAGAGVNVGLIVPGLVDTPIYDKVQNFAKAKEKVKEQVPRWLSSDDVAEAVLWMTTRPAHVAVSEIVLMPRDQPR